MNVATSVNRIKIKVISCDRFHVVLVKRLKNSKIALLRIQSL